MIKDKYVQMYNEFIKQLYMYPEAIQVKRLSTHFAYNSIEIEGHFRCIKNHTKKNESRL